MKIKKCSSCEVEKPLTAEYFYRQSSTATGFHAYCKECQAERGKKYHQKNKEAIVRRHKKYHQENKEAISRQRKEYRQKNKEAISRRQKEYRQKNKEAINRQQKEYHQKNKEVISRQQKKYRQENKEAICKMKKEWYEKNREAIIAQTKEYNKKNKEAIKKKRLVRDAKRRKEDPVFRLMNSIRSSFRHCLSGRNKNSRTFDYVGLTLEELMAYLEAKFTDGMTRDNYGKWHVDHIRPLSSFDFYKHELGGKEFEDLLHQAWHYTNLQPLWAKDNLSKGAKWDGKCK